MTEWIVDGAGFLLLLIGTRLGQPRILRAMCTLALTYLIIFVVVYFLWLKWKLNYFQTHPQMIHLGISAAFGFEGFWKLFANMVLLQGIMPVAGIFLIYFAIKWLSASVGPNSRFFS